MRLPGVPHSTIFSQPDISPRVHFRPYLPCLMKKIESHSSRPCVIWNAKVKTTRRIREQRAPVSFYLIWFTMKWPIKNNRITLLIKQRGWLQGTFHWQLIMHSGILRRSEQMYSETVKLLLCCDSVLYLHSRNGAACLVVGSACKDRKITAVCVCIRGDALGNTSYLTVTYGAVVIPNESAVWFSKHEYNHIFMLSVPCNLRVHTHSTRNPQLNVLYVLCVTVQISSIN